MLTLEIRDSKGPGAVHRDCSDIRDLSSASWISANPHCRRIYLTREMDCCAFGQFGPHFE
jgi:hypothetical protein